MIDTTPDPEDILSASGLFTLLGGKDPQDDEILAYGKLRLSTPEKKGKASTLLSDHLFSPSLLLAERIDTGEISFPRRKMVELGSGAGLPGLLLSTTQAPPSLVVLTEYPDEDILANLKLNIQRNIHHISPECRCIAKGFEWGEDASELLIDGPYDVVLASDLLHFGDSHEKLLSSITTLLARDKDACVLMSAGRYTEEAVCQRFLDQAMEAGLAFTEHTDNSTNSEWRGAASACQLTDEQLIVRKNNCRYWIGRWKTSIN